MYDLSSPDFWVVAAGGLALGLLLGWLATSLVTRRRAGGQDVAQLRREMDEYREEVNEHFAQTAELFKDATEKYRDLYEHLAGGAQGLCNDLPERVRVEFRPDRLLGTRNASGEQAGGESGPGLAAAKAPPADAPPPPDVARPAS